MHTTTVIITLLYMHKEVCITNRENKKQKLQKERIYITKQKNSEYKKNIEVRKKKKPNRIYIYKKDVKQLI